MTPSLHKTLYTLALRYLARREHAVDELRLKLKQKIKDDIKNNLDIINTVIQDLINKNYLNNARFTELYIRSRQNRGYGKLRIIEELKNKGITVGSNLFKHDNIQKIRIKKFGESMPCTLREKAKQIRFLQYRGFPLSDIRKVFNKGFINDDDNDE